MSKFSADQLAEYAGKQVTIVRNLADSNEAVEVEGKVQVGNQLGLLIKPKGKVQFDLIPIDEIEEVSLAKEGNKALKRSKLQPVKVGQARRHLLERHGYTLAWVNSVTEEQAAEHHDEINHEEADLGHIHVEKSEADDKDDSSDEE